MTVKNLHFSFRMDIEKDSKLIRKMQNPVELGFKDKTEMLRFMVRQYFENGSNSNDIKEEIKQEKLQSLKNKNDLHTLDKRNKDALTRINEYHADNLNTVGSNPSPQAKKTMSHYVNGTLPYDENAIYCPDCKFHTNSKDGISWQIDRLTDHMKNFHKRNFTEDEAKIISELLV